MISLMEVTTVAKVLEAQTPTIGNLKRTYGNENTMHLIAQHLTVFSLSLDIKRNLSEHNILECSMLIATEYPALTVADLNLIFRKAKLGDYGELYESLTVPRVMGWFRKYFDERCEIAGAISRQKANEHRAGERSGERQSLKSVPEALKKFMNRGL